jgi:hypothetical protein
MACAVHCLLVPLFTAFLPVAGASLGVFQHPALELAFALLVLSGASFTLFWGYRRHRDPSVLFGVLLGLTLYLLGHLGDGWLARSTSVGGALILSLASFASARLSHTHSEQCAH